MSTISFFIHVYYPGSWKKIKQKCAHAFELASNIIVTACHDEVIKEVKDDMPQVQILKVPNKGKDIGGKLAAISYYINFCSQSPYLAFLHDKISPQTLNPDYWFGQLYQLFEEDQLNRIVELFNKNSRIGIAGSKTFLKNEYLHTKKQFNSTNNAILQQLISRYGLESKEYNFIGGTVFMVRNEIFYKFFSDNSPLGIRESLEAGNVLDLNSGSYTHSWERLFCFIAQNQGYKVIGV